MIMKCSLEQMSAQVCCLARAHFKVEVESAAHSVEQTRRSLSLQDRSLGHRCAQPGHPAQA